jgi:hypothetical protein
MDRSAVSIAAPERDAHRGADARRAGSGRAAAAARWSLLGLVRALAHRLHYRPERHYMRGRRSAAASGPEEGMVGVAR